MSKPVPGTATRDREALCPCIRAKYDALLVRAREAGVAVSTIETRRDLTRQKHYVKTGVSQTLDSYHLPQPPKEQALAFDLAPTSYLKLPGWNVHGPLWDRLAAMGRELGLEWGGDWPSFKDKPHYQQKKCTCPVKETTCG